ncbi:MFS glucose transporter, partial [Lipomyces orientalis]
LFLDHLRGEPNADQRLSYTWKIVGHPAVSRTIRRHLFSSLRPSELRVRAKAVSLATAANWATSFALGFSVPPLFRSIRFLLFGFNTGAFFHVCFMPETKQRTLEEMDEVSEHGEPLWKPFTSGGDTNKLDKLARDIELGICRVGIDSNLGRRR